MAADPTWPALPRHLYAPGGFIAVRLVVNPRSETDTVEEQAAVVSMGLWRADIREIRLRKTMPMATLWNTLYHEWTHAVLDDVGLSTLIPETLLEPLVDAIGLARMQELRVQRGLLG